MSTIRKAIIVNPIEPAPLSFRCPTRIDSILEVTYYKQGDPLLPYSTDLDGQMRLTGRSDKCSKSYSVPAIDVANGKARAIIPAGDVNDPNGHLLTFYGSVAGAAGMIARGLVWPDAAVEPLEEPIDVIDVVPIELFRSQPTDSAFIAKLWDDTGKTDPYEVGAGAIGAAIFASQGGLKIVDMSVTLTAVNAAQISLTQAQVTPLPNDCWWVLQISSIDGITTLCEGPVTVHD